ncbi:TPA: hypothetical protein ACGX4E_002488, partial [Listeria monocytogenes]|nr:hypothetical protein [Listeria monocytogenes]EAE2862872.1 hypothetical protein [Listeria monocytogenes]EAE4522644.1 hypothetical protein [Listeria monocytogenes]EED2466210.1 hypothetical protein [Listeria monocytogenes]EFQ8010122.1 hypothetical protein [Listeria monocytogenes]
MAYETAYSKELKRNDITALEANQYFHEGILTDSKAFQCSEVCSVPLTCANFTKKSSEWNKSPYFRSPDASITHSDNCSIKTKKNALYNETEEGSSRVLSDLDFLNLNIDLNQGFTEQKPTNTSTSSPNINLDGKKTMSNGGEKYIRTEIPQIKSLSKIVTYYFSDDWDNNKLIIKVKGGEVISFNDLFQNLDSENDILKPPKIYYAEAKVIDKGDYYILLFNSACSLKGLLRKPTFLINKNRLKTKKILLNKLIRL